MDSRSSKRVEVHGQETTASPLSPADWIAVFEWCRETEVEFYLKPVREENPSLFLGIQAVEPTGLVARDGNLAFSEIEWIKVPFATPFVGKSQPDIRPLLKERGIRFEERQNGVVIRGRLGRQPSPA